MSERASAPPAGDTIDDKLVVAISSRALFDLGESHALFERDGLTPTAATRWRARTSCSAPASLSAGAEAAAAEPERAQRHAGRVILLSRNSADTGLRIFNSIEHYGLGIERAAFTNGAPRTPT